MSFWRCNLEFNSYNEQSYEEKAGLMYIQLKEILLLEESCFQNSACEGSDQFSAGEESGC